MYYCDPSVKTCKNSHLRRPDNCAHVGQVVSGVSVRPDDSQPQMNCLTIDCVDLTSNDQCQTHYYVLLLTYRSNMCACLSVCVSGPGRGCTSTTRNPLVIQSTLGLIHASATARGMMPSNGILTMNMIERVNWLSAAITVHGSQFITS